MLVSLLNSFNKFIQKKYGFLINLCHDSANMVNIFDNILCFHVSQWLLH